MTAFYEFSVQTSARNEWKNITRKIAAAVERSAVTEGVCVVFVPHTTAAVTVNENADADVPRDVVLALNAISPERAEFRHGEGNSDAHTKTALVGPSLTLLVHGGRLVLGTWQAVWFTEFDGPRRRTVFVRVLGE
ncbi:MAG: secondary thiamine-phosphate synthase enzyme YjbQ [Spirochaetaceae bacterium]|jgi:secondary thiamine-phosphate synthase enzyme|nr:secondary thiamine-phosphate synthase enzyme YjbQ [Spirochaetaceae bacterium]